MNAAEIAQLRKTLRFLVMYIPRTHFDLAWWMIMAVFQFRFEPVMTELLKVLEENARFRFTLDGQAALFKLYGEFATDPMEQVRRILQVKALVENGQLQIGPSYVLPDAFLTPGEFQIRNELLGRKISMSLGAPARQVIDHSDVFGAPAQKPQILAAFADYYFFTRGQHQDLIKHPAFNWTAPNGTGLIAVPHPGGYGNGYEFGRKSQEISIQTVRNFLNNYRERFETAGIPAAMLCGGGDHTALGGRILPDLETVRQLFADVDFEMGTDNDYAAALNLDRSKLPVYQGELHSSGRENILRGVNSTRTYLKQRNETVDRVLMQAETAVSLAALRLGELPDHWRQSLQRCQANFLLMQSHDGITGCHIDDVTANMLDLYGRIEQETNMVMQEAFAKLSGQEVPMAYRNRYGLVPSERFALWNPLPYPRREVAVVDLPSELDGSSRLSALVNGEPVQIQRLANNRAALLVSAGSFGAAQVQLGRFTGSGLSNSGNQNVMANEFLRVQVAPNGTINLTDLRSGRKFTALGRLVSQGDRGDTYNADLIKEDIADSSAVAAQVMCLSRGPLVQELKVTYDFEVPERLDPETRRIRQGRVTIPVSTLLRLRRGSRFLEFETVLTNPARDQLLRVVFPMKERLTESRAETPFMVQPYPIVGPTAADWKESTTDAEPPFNAHANLGLVMAGPFALFNRGLTEYEAYATPQGTELALTLLRGVSHLSQDDLDTRRGGAGPTLAVPGAQCLGEQRFSFALGLVGSASDVELAQAAQAWRHGFVRAPFGLDTAGLLDCSLSQSVFSALKPAEDGHGVVFRCWAGSEPAWVKFTGPGHRLRVKLDESPLAGQYGLVDPYEIATWRLA